MSRWAKYIRMSEQLPWLLQLAQHFDRRPKPGRWRFLDGLHQPRPAPLTPDLRDWATSDLAVCWLGHATLLIRIAGLTVLTDPVFSRCIGLGLGLCTLGPRRLIRPALQIEQLPPIDLILISHAHYDHLDRPSLSRLPVDTPVVISAHNRDLLQTLGYSHLTQLHWHQHTQLGSLRITALPVQHWGARLVSDRHRGYAGFLLEHLDPAGSPTQRLIFTGDTALHEHYRQLGPVDALAIGIGTYNPWLESHCTPEQAVLMAHHAQARVILPIHHATFVLSHEPLHEPMQRLEIAVKGSPLQIGWHQIGEIWRTS